MKMKPLIVSSLLLMLFSCENSDTGVNNDHDKKTPTSNMKLIPSKNVTFLMGNPNSPEHNFDVQHNVTFTYSYYMDSTEVTQKDFHDLMSKYNENYKALDWSDSCGKGDNYPAYMISWNYAAAYCNARSKEADLEPVYNFNTSMTNRYESKRRVTIDLTKNGFRLPTEAEFEFASRAKSENDFFWGKDILNYPQTVEDSSEMAKYVVWYGNSNGHSNIVASKLPNDFGLYDMSGNVEEWCNDHFGSYSTEDVIDPFDNESDTMRVLRGGAWSGNATYQTSNDRRWSAPNYNYYTHGFRCVLPVVD